MYLCEISLTFSDLGFVVFELSSKVIFLTMKIIFYTEEGIGHGITLVLLKKTARYT